MRNLWIRFGCFLTGYNYAIVRNSSEVAAKAVKRYTSAMIIVCILWAFVGYTFANRYLAAGLWGSIAGAVIAVIIIVQIERQIILSVTHNKALFVFRGLLALLMALIGAVIIDQIILHRDIELEKISYVDKRVDSLLPSATSDLRNQILSLDTTIANKERERQSLIDDVAKKPILLVVSSQTQSIPIPVSKKDSAGNVITSTEMKYSTTVVKTNVPNPKQVLIDPLNAMINQMRTQKMNREDSLLNIRPALVSLVNSKVGFLDELKVMYTLVSNSTVALCFWLLWFLFLLFIEMLVLFSKLGDKSNDYEKTVLHQMDLTLRKLQVLSRTADVV
jgi:hypothetical protein